MPAMAPAVKFATKGRAIWDLKKISLNLVSHLVDLIINIRFGLRSSTIMEIQQSTEGSTKRNDELACQMDKKKSRSGAA